MTCTREPVRMSGVLRSRQETANCMVSALRVTLAGTRFFKDCQYSIEWVSKPLPENDYKLSFCGQAVNMRYSQGHWRAMDIRITEISEQTKLALVSGLRRVQKGLANSESSLDPQRYVSRRPETE